MPSADEILPYLRAIDDNRWYSNFGPLVQELEQRLSERYDGAHVVTTSSGTAALYLAFLLEKERGMDRIGFPALTFPATALAAHAAGLKVILDDVDPATWTDGYVSHFGLPGYGPGVIDAAPAFGEQTCSPGTVYAFSLHATKVLGCGEGGYVVTFDKEEADWMRRMSNFGILPGAHGISEGPGGNHKMSEYHAAVALASLDRYDRAPWLRLFDWYAKYLPAGVITQRRPRGVYSLMPVVTPLLATVAQERLAQRNIETRRWYCPPLYMHPLFRDDPAKYPVTAELSQRLIGLPYHAHLTERDVRRVCEALKDAMGGRA